MPPLQNGIDTPVVPDAEGHDLLYLPAETKEGESGGSGARGVHIWAKNSRRRFRYHGADKKDDEQKAAMLGRSHSSKFKVNSRAVQAVSAFQSAGVQRRLTQLLSKTFAQPKHGFGVSTQALTRMMQNEDSSLLRFYGGVQGIAEKLQTDLQEGASGDPADALRRVDAFGTNVLPEKAGRTFWEFLWDAFQDFTLGILLVCALASLIIGIATEGWGSGWYDGAGIALSIMLVVLVTATSDYRQSLQFRDLNKEKAKIYVQVVHGGRRRQLLASDLLVGDIVHLSIGDQVPADGLLVEGHSFTVDESQMTGESEPVRKTPLRPYLTSGCKVSDGSGTMLVTAVGLQTEWGRLMSTLTTEEAEETPLQARLNTVATMVGNLGLTMAVLVFLILLARFFTEHWGHLTPWTGELTLQLVDYFAIAVTIVVVAVPEGLPLAVTLTLAFAMHKMMAEKALVRKLAACETMGSATTICSDKTGTLTMNAMTVVKAWVGGTATADPAVVQQMLPAPAKAILLEGICLNTTGAVYVPDEDGSEPEIQGSPTEKAVLAFGVLNGMAWSQIRTAWKIVSMKPFSSAKKKMGCLVSDSSSLLRAHWKGASEIVLASCNRFINKEGSIELLDSATRARVLEEITTMASASLRTLCLAYTEVDGGDAADVERLLGEEDAVPATDLILLAVVGIKDPCRPGVAKSVALCQKAGIVVRMVTGDNLTTARAIAEECGILAEGGEVIEGPVFRALPPDEMKALIPRLRVMARSSPTDKHLLVRMLQELGGVVSATGDGTNDAPALHQSNVGAAMGIAGTEVAKESAHVVILDDNFSTIVNVAKWGRSVYANIQKFVQFQLTVNIVALVLNFVSAILSGDAPLTAVQLLWVNLIMDTLGALALATDAPTDDLMDRPPVKRTSSLITNVMWRNILGMAAYQLAVLLALKLLGARHLQLPPGELGEKTHLTIIFNTFVLCQIFNELNSRDPEKLNVVRGVFQNPVFLMVVAATVLGQVIMVEFLGELASTVPLSRRHWGLSVGLGAASVPLAMLVKLLPVSQAPMFHFVPFCRKCQNDRRRREVEATAKKEDS